jgi:hypothetical protein
VWPFKKQPTVEDLRGYKKITINGMRFTIKRVNPLLDFHSDRMPQIFSDYESVREKPLPTSASEALKKVQGDMYDIILAGVVDPKMVPNGKDGGFTPEDMFRDPTLGVKLYHVIIEHSLNKFKGLSKVFFSIGIKYGLLMHYASGMVKRLAVWSLPKETSA